MRKCFQGPWTKVRQNQILNLLSGIPHKVLWTKDRGPFAEEGRKTNTECAIEAGYEENSAYVSASKLQNPLLYPLVAQYIGRLRAEKIKKYDITYEKHLAELGKIRDEARENKAWSAAGNMEIARGKAGGFQNNTNLHLHKNLDNADESELDKMLEQALKNYKPIFDSTAEVVEVEAEAEIEAEDEEIKE
jgi:phage terminase small subunit